MTLKLIISDLLVSKDPNLNRKYVVLDKGVKVIYVMLKITLYGLLSSALLFYLKVAIDLKNNGFIIIHMNFVWQKNRLIGEK